MKLPLLLTASALFCSMLLNSVLPTHAMSEENSARIARLIYLGDSLTAGYGVGRDLAYPNLIEQRLRKEGHLVETINAGVSGDTSAGGLRRLDWVLQKNADVLFIALGANDMLRGQDPEGTLSNIRSIVNRAKKKHPNIEVIVSGLKALPSMGRQYRNSFESIFEKIEKQDDVILLENLLEGVEGSVEFNQEDRIHPNKQGQQKIADSVYPFIKRALTSRNL